MEDNFFTHGGGGVGVRDGFKMIPGHSIYGALYFYSVPPQIIRHETLEVGDPCAGGYQRVYVDSQWHCDHCQV